MEVENQNLGFFPGWVPGWDSLSTHWLIPSKCPKLDVVAEVKWRKTKALSVI